MILLQTVPTHIQVNEIKEKLEQVSFLGLFGVVVFAFFNCMLKYMCIPNICIQCQCIS